MLWRVSLSLRAAIPSTSRQQSVFCNYALLCTSSRSPSGFVRRGDKTRTRTIRPSEHMSKSRDQAHKEPEPKSFNLRQFLFKTYVGSRGFGFLIRMDCMIIAIVLLPTVIMFLVYCYCKRLRQSVFNNYVDSDQSANQHIAPELWNIIMKAYARTLVGQKYMAVDSMRSLPRVSCFVSNETSNVISSGSTHGWMTNGKVIILPSYMQYSTVDEIKQMGERFTDTWTGKSVQLTDELAETFVLSCAAKCYAIQLAIATDQEAFSTARRWLQAFACLIGVYLLNHAIFFVMRVLNDNQWMMGLVHFYDRVMLPREWLLALALFTYGMMKINNKRKSQTINHVLEFDQSESELTNQHAATRAAASEYYSKLLRRNQLIMMQLGVHSALPFYHLNGQPRSFVIDKSILRSEITLRTLFSAQWRILKKIEYQQEFVPNSKSCLLYEMFQKRPKLVIVNDDFVDFREDFE